MDFDSLARWEDMPWGTTEVVLLFFAAALWVQVAGWKSRKLKPLPPGPKGWPLIGNLLQIPTEHPWRVYKEWGQQYGGIIYLEALGQKILVLNSLSSINELLVKRAPNYSDRVWTPLIELSRSGWAFSVMNYGQQWRDNRRTFHKLFNHTKVHRYHSIIEQEVPLFLKRLLNNPNHFREETQDCFGTIIMRISYGAEDPEYNKQLVHTAETLVEGFMKESAPGRLLVNIIPALRYVPPWFPGAGWRTRVEKLALLGDDIKNRPFRDVEERMKTGTHTEYLNIAAELIGRLPDESDPNYLYEREIARGIAAQSYIAGSDTTASSAAALLLALAMHPEVQRKAQAQIDAVIGKTRLPAFSNLEDLPYIQAIVKEVNRWHTVAPFSVPHVSREDDIFNGYRISAKTIIIPNSWAIMHDPEIFEDPMEFKPERYLKDGKIDRSVLDPEAAAFGYGRRICPGRHLSNDALALVAASLLACFEIRPSKDEVGNPIPLALELPSSLITAPLPFRCEILPRSEKHHALLNDI